MGTLIALPAGSYNWYDTNPSGVPIAGPTSVTVAALTAGTISPASPSVGATLSVTGSNAPPGAAFLWEVSTNGGTSYGNAGGTNNEATYDTTGQPGGLYRRRTTLVNGATATTPAVTLAAGSISTPTFVHASNPGASINTSTGWTSGTNLFPAAGTYLVATIQNTGATDRTSQISGSAVESATLLGMSFSGNDALCLHLVVTSAASTINVRSTTGTAFLFGVTIHTIAGATAADALTGVVNSNTAASVSVTLTSVPASRWVVTAFHSGDGTTSAYALGGGLVSGDLISARGFSGSNMPAWTSGDLMGLAFKQVSAGDFTSTVTLTDDGTRGNRMVSAALAAA